MALISSTHESRSSCREQNSLPEIARGWGDAGPGRRLWDRWGTSTQCRRPVRKAGTPGRGRPAAELSSPRQVTGLVCGVTPTTAPYVSALCSERIRKGWYPGGKCRCVGPFKTCGSSDLISRLRRARRCQQPPSRQGHTTTTTVQGAGGGEESSAKGVSAQITAPDFGVNSEHLRPVGQDNIYGPA